MAMRGWLGMVLVLWLMLAQGRAWGGDAPPTLSDLAATVTTNRNVATSPLQFTISDDLTSVTDLVVAVRSSSNPTVIPTANCVLGGSNANRTLTITPAPGQTGTSTVTLRVTDAGGLFVEDAIVVTVNAPPTMTGLAATVQTNLNTVTAVLPFTITDDQGAASLTVSVQSSTNPTVIPIGNCVLAGSAGNRTLTITPAFGQSGTSTVAVRVTDGDGLFAEQSVTVTVNGPPTLTGLPTAPITIDQYGSQSLPFTIGDDLTTVANLVITVASSNQTVIPNANCVVTTTAVVTNRLLTITPAGAQFTDNITITVTVSDGPLSTQRQFVVSVKEINRPPVITSTSTAHNYSLKVGGYAQILPDSVVITDPDGQPRLKTDSNYLRITARITVNRVANQDRMDLRETERCTLSRLGSNYTIRWRANNTVLADVATADDGSLTITVGDGAQTVANSGNPAIGSALVLAELLKAINYTNQAGRFANITPPTREVEITVVEGRPASMTGGQTPTTVPSVITLLLDNEPPENIPFDAIVVSPGGIGRLVFPVNQSGVVRDFDTSTGNQNLMISVNSPPNGGEVIDLVTGLRITTSFPGSRLMPGSTSGIGYRNINPNFSSDGFTLRVADADNLSSISNVVVRIDSNATGETRIVSDPLLVMDRGTAKGHLLTVVGPTLTDVVLSVTNMADGPLSPSTVTWPSTALKTDANGSAQTTLTINAPATGTYLEFILKCTIGGTTTKQPFLIRLMPVAPLSASN